MAEVARESCLESLIPAGSERVRDGSTALDGEVADAEEAAVEEVGEAFVQERLGLSTEDGEGQ